MKSEHLFAGIHVGEIPRARDFYERLLGREPDLVPNSREVAWQLHEGAWIVLIAGGAEPGGAQHTLILEELDGFLGEVRSRGIVTGPVKPVGPGMVQSIVVDPDGNRLKLAAPQS